MEAKPRACNAPRLVAEWFYSRRNDCVKGATTGQATVADDRNGQKPTGMSRAKLIAMTVAIAIGLGILIIQAARRLVMAFNAAG